MQIEINLEVAEMLISAINNYYNNFTAYYQYIGHRGVIICLNISFCCIL